LIGTDHHFPSELQQQIKTQGNDAHSERKTQTQNENANVMLLSPNEKRRHAHSVNTINAEALNIKRNVGQEIHAGLPFPNHAERF
jgi:hypothetical protein